MAKIIKQINLGTASNPDLYDIYDAYARRRLEGAGTVYSISHAARFNSAHTYFDITEQAVVTLTADLVANASFNSYNADASVAATKYLITLNQTATANQYYVIKIANLTIGDSVFVKETGVSDRWLSALTADNGTFSKLEEKIDLSSYATKSIAGKAGTYVTAASTGATGSAGEQTAAGSASVTYSKASTATGSAGGATVTTTAANGSTAANTGTAGGVTINGSNFTFTGSAATLTMETDAATIDDHTFIPEGTVSTVSAASHTHTVTLNTSSTSVVTSVDAASGSAGAHTHSVTGKVTAAGSISEGTVTADAPANFTPAGSISAITASAHSHTVNAATASKTFVTGVNNAASAGAHSHTIDSHSHGANVTAVTGYSKFSGGSLTGTKTFVTGYANFSGGSLTGTKTFVTAATVSSDGVLSWNTGTVGFTAASLGTASTGTVGFTAAALGTPDTTTVAAAPAAATLTTASAGAHTHTVGASGTATITYMTGATLSTAGAINVTPTFTGTAARLNFIGSEVSLASGSAASAGAHTHSIGKTAVTLTYATGVKSVSSNGAFSVTPTFKGTAVTLAHAFTDADDGLSLTTNFTPAGSIGGSQTIAAHSHSYNAPASHSHSVTISGHTHSIALTDETASGTVSVAISAHTHSLGNHTHNVTIPNCAA